MGGCADAKKWQEGVGSEVRRENRFPMAITVMRHFRVDMLWFNFILGFNFISICFGEW